MRREVFDVKREDAFKSARDYVVHLAGVDFFRDVHKGMWRGPSEDSEVGWHDQRDCAVGRTAVQRVMAVKPRIL